MADFSAKETNMAPVQNYVTPKEGVEKPSPIGPLAQGVDAALNIFGTARKAKATEEANKGLMEHQRNILRIADAHAQNRITQSEAQRRMRGLLMDVADRVTDPKMFQEYARLQGDLLGLTGAAAVVKEGSLEEQQRRDQIDSAVSNGILNPNDVENANKVDYAVRIQQQFSSEQYLFDQENARIDNILKRQDLSDRERKQAKAEQQEAALRGIRGMGPAELQQASSQLDALATNPDLSEAERVQAITEAHASFQAAAKQKYGAAGQEVVNDFISPYNDIVEMYKKKATGELADAEAERSIERSVRGYQELISKDPSMVRAIAMSDMVNLPGLVESGAIAKGVFDPFVDFLGAAQEGKPKNVANLDDGDESTAFSIYMDTVMEAAKSGDADKAEEAYTHLETVLGSIEEYEGSFRKDAKAGILPAKIFASKEFLDAVTSNPDLLPSLNGAAQTMEDYYSNEVWLMVNDEFRKSGVRSFGGKTGEEVRQEFDNMSIQERNAYIDQNLNNPDQPAAEAISVEWTGTGLRFRANDPTNPASRNKASSLNKKLKPVIETTIKAQAHLSGSTDYQGVWEAVSQDILGGAGSDDLEGSEDGDELFIEDFIFPSFDVESLPDTVQNDSGFVSKVEELASKYEIDPAYLMAVMDFETGGSFSPSQKNAAGSSATGLIQFMASTARELGTSTTALAKMDRLEQLEFVEKYLDRHADKIRGGDVSDVYMSVLYPRAAGKSKDYVLFHRGTKAYAQNKGLDSNGDGTVTKAEAASKVTALADKYRSS